jgi:hypothetical protein
VSAGSRSCGRRSALATVAVATAVTLTACGSASHTDDRSVVKDSINTVIQRLNGAGDIEQSSAVTVGECAHHRAAEAWQARLTTRALQLAASQRSFEVTAIFTAHIGKQFSTTSVRQADSYETYTATDKAGTTLVFTVPGGEYVRIDGSLSC